MKKWIKFYFIVVGFAMVVVWFVLVAPLITSHYEVSPVKYSGKEVFYTEVEYSQFKEAVGQKDVEIMDVLVLSSDPPIVVEFNVSVPYDRAFDYGIKGKHTGFSIEEGAVAYFLIGGYCLLFMPWLINNGRGI